MTYRDACAECGFHAWSDTLLLALLPALSLIQQCYVERDVTHVLETTSSGCFANYFIPIEGGHVAGFQ